jgi:hypothetical protein
MVTSDPLVPSGSETPARDPRKCSARSKRSGRPCERWSMAGQTVCMMHGGKSKQALARAEEMVQLAELKLRGLAPRAVAELEALVTSADSEQVRLHAANSLIDRSVGRATERIQVAAAITVRRPW